jgi:hypothetical protein
MSMKEILRRKNSAATSRKVSPSSLLDDSDSNFQRALLDESGMIINHMGTHNRS